MKELMALILVFVCMFSLVACSNQKGQDYVNAEVLEITETEIIAECVDGSVNQLAGTTIAVSKEVISADGVPEIQTGDGIRVVFDFSRVDQSDHPVKIEHVYAVYLMDEHGTVIPNE